MSKIQRATAAISRAERVTFFEDRAEVSRTAKATVAAGTTELEIDGLSPYVDDLSLRARVASGAARVVAAKVQRAVREERAASEVEIDTLERMQRALLDQQQAMQLEEQRMQHEHASLSSVFQQLCSALAAVPRGVGDEAGAAAWRRSFDEVSAALERSEGEIASHAEARQTLSDEIEASLRRVAQARSTAPKTLASALVQLEGDAEGELAIELIYRVPCALWRPEHHARLVTDEAQNKASVEVVTWATAWQRTGEEWRDVEVRFSTARPARAADAPITSDDVLLQRRKTDVERRQVNVEVRDQAVAVAGVDRMTKDVDEMPGVDDGGEPKSFTAASRVSIASDGKAFRLEIARGIASAVVDLVAYPERSTAPHLRATATWSAPHALLAGPVRVARSSSIVGRAKLPFVAQGEVFELGFGTDDAIRVRRTVDESKDTVAIVGTQKVLRKVTLWLSNVGRTTKSVTLTERVPVSEIDEVKVSFAQDQSWVLDGKTGFARRATTLDPNSTKSVSYSYELRAAAKVNLPF